MQLKLDEAGHVVVQDGKPVYVHQDGKEAAFDVPDMYNRLTRDGKAIAETRKAVEEANARLKMFEGLDPEAARKALETVANINDGDLVKAGKVEEIKAAAHKAAEERIAAAQKQLALELDAQKKRAETFEAQLYDEKIGGSFSRSKFINEKVAVPVDLLQAQFGKNFKVENGQIVARDHSGNQIYSRANPGDVAGFEEAIETIINSYPHKDMILKGTNSTGGGARQSNGGGGANGKTIPRAEFERLPPMQQAALMGKADRPEIV